jgi:hypothetical protein
MATMKFGHRIDMSKKRTGSAGAARNTRDLGLVGGNGKGDADRTDNNDAFQRNFDLIDWGKNKTKKTKP